MIKRDIEKGDIWLVNLSPSRRGELGKNSRPCIVIQTNEANKILPCVVAVPLSSKKQKTELEIKITPDAVNNLKKESYVVWWHIYTIDKSSLKERIGSISDEILTELSCNIIDTLGFSEMLE